MEQKMNKTRVLVECAILIALAIVLSYIKFDLGAEGGSVSLVMVPLVLIAFRHGSVWGIAAGLVFGFVKCVIGEWTRLGIALNIARLRSRIRRCRSCRVIS